MSVIATLIDIICSALVVLAIIGLAATLFAIGYILYKEIRDTRGDDDE